MKVLLSVSDKTGLVEFAQGLHDLGMTLLSTGGTYTLLKQHHIPALPVEEVTGFPEILDGRVKTLHPKVHGGLLAKRDDIQHMATCKAHKIDLIDLLVVNLYPFEKTIQQAHCTLENAIENIDIGGPAMIRSAAKNYQDVGVVVNPSVYPRLLKELQDNEGVLSLGTKKQLCYEAFQHTALYDAMIAQYLNGALVEKTLFPSVIIPVLHQEMPLRYGENPHQKAAFYTLKGQSGFSKFKKQHGKELSFNNILDIEVAAEIVHGLSKPAVTIIKHNNPCAVAVGSCLLDAFNRAWECDSLSAFGGIIGSNQPIDTHTAMVMSSFFIEAIIAPSFSKEAFEILSQKPSLRLVTLPAKSQAKPDLVYKYVEGGFLIQTPDDLSIQDCQVVTKKQVTEEELEEMLFGFHVCKFIKSNAIVVSQNGQTLGIGAGQMSRVDAVENALKKAGEKAKGAVLSSDAFFPFKDNVLKAAEAGIACIIQPGGSVRDEESIQACNDHGIAMVFTGIRHFRH